MKQMLVHVFLLKKMSLYNVLYRALYCDIASLLGDFVICPQAFLTLCKVCCMDAESDDGEFDEITFAAVTLMYAEDVIWKVHRGHSHITVGPELMMAACLFSIKLLSDESINLMDVANIIKHGNTYTASQICNEHHLVEVKYMHIFFETCLSPQRYDVYVDEFKKLYNTVLTLSVERIQRWWRLLKEHTPPVKRRIVSK
jgi:hypothetical protein